MYATLYQRKYYFNLLYEIDSFYIIYVQLVITYAHWNILTIMQGNFNISENTYNIRIWVT